MSRKVLQFGLLYLISGINWIVADEPVGTESRGTSFLKGITITQQHVDVAKALVDYMFSYGERHPENQVPTVKPEEIKIEATIPATAPRVTVRVGVLSDCFPFTAKQGDKWVGFEIGLIKLVAEEENLNCEFYSMNIAEMNQKLLNKTVDVALGARLKDTAEEEKNEFSIGYLGTDLGVVRQKKQKGSAYEKLSLLGKKVGVQEGTYLETYIRSAHIQDAEIITFNTTGEMFKALLDMKQKRLDLVLIDKNTAQYWIAKNPELEYISLNMAREYAFCVVKGSLLLETINSGMGKVLGTQKFIELKRCWSIEGN